MKREIMDKLCNAYILTEKANEEEKLKKRKEENEKQEFLSRCRKNSQLVGMWILKQVLVMSDDISRYYDEDFSVLPPYLTKDDRDKFKDMDVDEREFKLMKLVCADGNDCIFYSI